MMVCKKSKYRLKVICSLQSRPLLPFILISISIAFPVVIGHLLSVLGPVVLHAHLLLVVELLPLLLLLLQCFRSQRFLKRHL